MGLTYTTGHDRRLRHARREGLRRGETLILAATAVAALAIALAYAGRMRSADWAARDRAAAPVNLTVVTDAAALEPALSAAFEQLADRRLAAATLAQFLKSRADQTALPNVGAIARVEIEVGAVDRMRQPGVFVERLARLRAAATEAKRDPPTRIPLFGPGDLGAAKPALAVRTAADFRQAVVWCAVVFLAAFPVVAIVWRWRGLAGDHLLLSLAFLLTTIGFVLVLTRPDPLRDTLLLVRYTQGVVIGLAVFAIASAINLQRASFLRPSYVPLLGALTISVVLVVFGSGPGSSGAKVNLGPVQPIEAIRLLLSLFLAGYFARRWELIRQVRARVVGDRQVPAWLNMPRLDHVLPVVAGVAMALGLFFVQRDLGPALLLSLIFLSMFAVARGGTGLALTGLALLAAGFFVGYYVQISTTLAARVAMWQSPWDNAVRGGDQVAQAVWALAAGGATGTGLGLGHTRYLPEGHTDLVLAAVGEELGFVGLIVVAAACALLAYRGLQIARRSASDYGFFLALALTLSLVVPVVVMGAGMLGAIPLTGVVTPFLSYGGSAMVANFAALGLLVAIQADGRPAADLAAFQRPVRWLGATLAASAAALVVACAAAQIVYADEYLVRPQLGRQADGGRRFQYNPRVLDAMRSIPRGAILDREGRPLAAGDPTVCKSVVERCYPTDASLFHILGDSRTQRNWSASNTSYVERDADNRLRGFDDRAAMVAIGGGRGTSGQGSDVAIRRDYRDLVPLVRHRYEPDHAAVKALLSRPRDVRLTVDALLQDDVAALVSRAAVAAKVTKAAAVVLDASTGEVLASVSYPWPGMVGAFDSSLDRPSAPRADRPAGRPASDALFNRARYGLYPPGSTFKMITAAAALRQDVASRSTTFACARLADGRVGAKIPGWSRPIRDDVHNVNPHGRIGLQDAVVRSCNAYFAQLAVALGPEVLSRMANEAGIQLTPSRVPARAKETLPHAGYGQGDVVATPLRLARVAAAIGSDGVIRERPVIQGASGALDTPWLDAESARLLAGYLRDAVVSGTGRVLKDHPARIAGKTGTAEVDEAASHAWFVGVAPHGPAARRIAFAVLLENAGYGGATAAALAGQIVTAAAARGVVR